MTSWQEMAAAALAAAVFLVLAVRSARAKARDRKWRAAERKLTTVLQPRETVRSICDQKKGRCILTNKRLLWETRDGFTAVALKDIKKVQGNTKDGKTTTVPAKMVSLTVKGPEEYTIRNTGPGFPELAGQLRAQVKKQNQKKK